MIFAQISDLHLDNNSNRLTHLDPYRQVTLVLDDLVKKGLKDIIFTGDIAESVKSVGRILKELKRRQLNPIFSFGNHDIGFTDRYPDYNDGDELYFKKTMEGNLCIFLDSCSGFIDSKQTAWFENSIQGYSRRIYIFTHYPILDCGNRFMDRKDPLRNRTEFLKILNRLRNDIVIFCGHYHTTLEIQNNHIKQYLTPSTLYQISLEGEELEITDEPIGYRIIEMAMSEYKTYVQELMTS